MILGEGLLIKGGESILNDFYKSAKGRLKSGWQKFDWQTAKGLYFKKIEEDYGRTRILGKPEPISLEGIFTDVYLLDKPTALWRFDIIQLQKDPDILKQKQERVSGIDLVTGGKLKRLFILGKPGAGKTTFLKYIALKCAQNEIGKIPIFVSLKEWSDSGLELISFIVREFDICHFPDAEPLIEYFLDSGLAIVLLDGLDEAQQEDGKRDVITNKIREFSRKYYESHIVLTCRIATTDYTFEEFTYVEVADFTSRQVEIYVTKWFKNDLDKQNQFKAEYKKGKNKRLREMANTPLLLSLLCLNFEETGIFPQRRVEFYEEGINALLHKWDASRSIRRDEIYKGLSLGRKRQMFARIAAQTFEKNEYFLQKAKLVKMIVDYLSKLPNSPPSEEIDGDAVLKAIEAQHSILVERAKDIYSFSHLTFQEYFTAKYIVDNTESNTIDRLLTLENINNNRWREVILNTVSLLDSADNFLKVFSEIIIKPIATEKDIVYLFQWVEFKANMKKKTREEKDYNWSEISIVRSDYFVLVFLLILINTQDFNETYTVVNAIMNAIDFSSSLLPTLFRNFQYHSSKEFLFNLERAHYLKLGNKYLNDFKQPNEIHLIRSLTEFGSMLLSEFSLVRSYYLSRKLTKNENKNDIAEKNIELQEAWEKVEHCLIYENGSDFRMPFQLPYQNSQRKTWTKFVNELRDFLRTKQKVRLDWRFSIEQLEILNQYFAAAVVLAECLTLAMVSNRKEIEDSLLKLPQ